MKQLVLLFILHIQFISISQIPDYFLNNPTWRCTYHDMNTWVNENEVIEEYTYYLNGDTTIQNETYKKVFRFGYYYYPSDFFTQYPIEEFTEVCVRQDGNSIRFCKGGIIDSLLVDYSIQVGEIQTGYIATLQPFGPVQKIDSLLINDEYRKQFYYDTLNSDIRVIEGVGHFSVATLDGEFILPLVQGIGFYYRLNCVGFDAVPVWSTDVQNECELNVGIPEVQENEEKKVLKIVDLLGREIEAEANKMMMILYNDGTVEQRMIVE